MKTLYPGDSWEFPLDGVEFTATIDSDDCNEAPWLRSDGHVEVRRVASNYGTKHGPSKSPGEFVFHRGGCREHSYVVNIPDAIALALQGGWHGEGRTSRERAANAVARDIEFVRGWCADEWCYVGVTVSHGGETNSLWGIESCAADYIRDDVCPDLARDLMRSIAINENTEVYCAD